jgi:phage-related baseplate assembly protein
LHEGTGWIEIFDPGLNKGDKLRIKMYSYYTGLLKQVQTVLNGVEHNPAVYPGISSAGVKVLATFPRPKTIYDIRASIQVREGYEETEIAPLVMAAINKYLTDLKVGDDIILSEMIERSMAVDGMYDIQIISPTDNVVILEDEILDLENLDIIIS